MSVPFFLNLAVVLYVYLSFALVEPIESESTFHYEILSMQYTDIFSGVKYVQFIDKNYSFLIFSQNIDCGYTSTHNLCFGARIIKIGIPLRTPVLLHKSGV